MPHSTNNRIETISSPAASAPLVSIIIPCYNSENWIQETIQSALDQTYSNFEIIVIDDGSTDATLNAIKTFGDRISWETGPNRGGNAARNRGLELARGEWIQFLDADDILHRDKVQSQMRFAKTHPNHLINCRLIRFHSSVGDTKDSLKLPCVTFTMDPKDFIIRKRLGELAPIINPTSNPSTAHSITGSWLSPMTLLREIGPWREDLLIMQDTEYFDRACLASSGVVFDGGAICFYRQSNNNSVSKGMKRHYATSFFEYCKSTRQILQYENSDRARIGVAMTFFGFIARFYPMHKDLCRASFSEIDLLQVPARTEVKHRSMRLLSWVIGRKMAILTIRAWQSRRSEQK